MLIRIFTKLQTKLNNNKKEIQEKNPTKIGMFHAFGLFILQIFLSLTKLAIILFKNSPESFKDLIHSPSHKTYSYSYYEYKVFQRRIRITSVAGVAIIVVIFSAPFLKPNLGRFFVHQKIVIYNVKVENVSKTTAVVTWNKTPLDNSATGGYVEYGKDVSYGKIRQHEDQNTSHAIHTVALTDLLPNTLYHFRIIEKDKKEKSFISSEDYTFTTSSFPVISSEEIKRITDTSAKITFQTNIPTNSWVVYKALSRISAETENENLKASTEKSSEGLVTVHEVTIHDLELDKGYDIILKARDGEGNEVEKQLSTFSTSVDVNPPVISSFRVESSIVPRSDGVIQTIITWKTDEPSSSQVTYQDGIDLGLFNDTADNRLPLAVQTNEDTTFTKDHAVVLTDLKPNTSYQFRAVSRDSQKNQAVSRDQVVFTPKQKKTFVDYIIKSVEDLFELIAKAL